MNVYLDYQSAKPLDAGVIEAMYPYYTQKFGNASSLHSIGDESTNALEASRKTIAEFIGAEASEIYFTSGATEANNIALIGYAMRNESKGNHLIISEIEHISIHNIVKYLSKNGFNITTVPVDMYGIVSLKKIEERLQDETILVSIGYANNEIGTIQPIHEIGSLLKDRGIAFHTDAVAAQGLLPIDVINDSIDLLSLSSNDIYGPIGVGALYIKKGKRVNPLLIGGGQENGIRSGTENIPGIVGMAKAAEISKSVMEDEVSKLTSLRDILIKRIPETIPDAYLNGHREKRLANNVHFRFDGIEGESLLLSLKDMGISVSTGSACTSKTLAASHTLISMGLLHEEAHGSLQLTLGRFNKEHDIDYLLEKLPEAVDRLRRLSPLYKMEATK